MSTTSLPLFRSTLLGCAVFGLLGCLPDPDIHVPDFSIPPPSDGGGMPTDGGGGELGAAKWTLVDTKTGTSEHLRAAWVADSSLSQVYVVGQNGFIMHRSGGNWQREIAKDGLMNPITANLYAVTALGGGDEAFAAGAGGVILHRTGSTWRPEGQNLMSLADLYGITTLASGDLVLVGDNGVIARRANNTYVAEDTSALAGASLRAVWGSKDADLIAVGMSGMIAVRMQTRWVRDPATVATMGNLYAVTSDGSNYYVAGDLMTMLTRGTTATTWSPENTIMPMMGPLHFRGLYFAGGDVLAVGTGGNIQRRSGASKMWSVEMSGTMADLEGIAGAGLRSAVAVGTMGTVLLRN